MSGYAVDSKRQVMRETGIVDEVKGWVELDGRRRPSETQARDENTGMPLWAVEVIYRQSSWGRESNTTATVTVGSLNRPVVEEFGRVEFTDLWIGPGDGLTCQKSGGEVASNDHLDRGVNGYGVTLDRVRAQTGAPFCSPALDLQLRFSNCQALFPREAWRMVKRWCSARATLLATAALSLSACGLIESEPASQSASTPSAAQVVEVAPEPSPTVTVTEAPPPPRPVALTDQGIGDVFFGTAGAYAALIEALGEPTQGVESICGFAYAEWDGLTVYFNDAPSAELAATSAFGWALSGGPLLDTIRAPYGIYPGQPISLLQDKGAQTSSRTLPDGEPAGDGYVTVLDGYAYYSETDHPDSPIAHVEAHGAMCS